MGCIVASTSDKDKKQKTDTKSSDTLQKRQAIYIINDIQEVEELPIMNPIIRAEEKQGVEQIQIFEERLYKLQPFEMEKYPYCSIGAITARDKRGLLVKGSGALISNCFVLTAAHVVFNRKQGPLYKSSKSEEDKEYGASYENIRFYPAVYNKLQQQHGIEVECWRYPLQYGDFQSKNFQAFDYAILKLKHSVPRPVGGFLQPKAYSQQSLLKENNSETNLQIFGYPYKEQAGFPNYEPLNNDGTVFKIFQYGLKRCKRIKKINHETGIICYQISTASGQSGCPIVFGEHYIGIHARGYRQQQSNGGSLFTQQMICKLKGWENEMNGESIMHLSIINPKQFKQNLQKKSKIKQMRGNIKKSSKNKLENMKKIILQNEQQQQRTELIQINPNSAEAYYNRGKTYTKLSKYSKALADYTKAVQINPDYAIAYYNRGLTYTKLSKYSQALADYTKAVQINPDYAKAYYNRAKAYTKLSKYQYALADYTKAIQINPVYAKAYKNRGTIYYDLSQYSQALVDYTRAIQTDPNYADAYCNRGKTYTKLSKYSQALADYKIALSLRPNNPLYLICIAQCSFNLNDRSALADSFLQCSFAFSSETTTEIKRRFGLSDINIDFIRSELSRLQNEAIE